MEVKPIRIKTVGIVLMTLFLKPMPNSSFSKITLWKFSSVGFLLKANRLAVISVAGLKA